MPEDIADIIPVLPTVATEELDEAQEPPDIEADNEEDVPEQSVVVPVMVPAPVEEDTVTDLVVKQLPGSEYVMIADPAAIPVTVPVALTVAIEVLLLDQVPPVAPLVNVAVLPTQTDDEPEIASGVAFTETTVDEV